MFSRRVMPCLIAVALASSMTCVPLAQAGELSIALSSESQLDRLKAQAVSKIDAGRSKYKKDMTAAKRKQLTRLRTRVVAARSESAVSTALGKAEVTLIKAKLLHKDKARAVKRSAKLYSAHKGYMDKEQRASFIGNKKGMGKATTQSRLSSLLVKRDLMVDRAKLARHIDTKGWSRGRVDFVSGWGARNNAYLDGTPMAGTGYLIADAAYRNGIDPRLYSAISEIESGRGAQPYGSQYNVCGWVWNPPAMYSWQDAADKWHAYFKSYFEGETYPIQSMHGYCGYGPWYVNEEMAKI